MAIALAIAVLGGALAIALFTTWYLRAPRVAGWPTGLVAHRRALGARVAALAERLPDAPRPLVEESFDGAAAVEADLLAGRTERALAAAESLVAGGPEDPARHLLLSRALLAAGQPHAALHAARRAANLGARGARLQLALGLAGHRARSAAAPAAPGVESPYPALLTPYELFILELERHRSQGAGATAVWLARLGNTSLTADQLLAAVTEHVAAYCDDLDHLVVAAEAEPALVEASYHAARLAVKLGLIEPARALFDALERCVAGSPVEAAYRRDLATLRDQELPPIQPPIPSGRRSIALRILK